MPAQMAQLRSQVTTFVQSLTHRSCTFILNTEKHPFSGGECTVFALESNGGRIAVRIEKSTRATRFKVEQEVEFLKEITRAGIEHLPQLIGYDLAAVPPLIATRWADGMNLVWTDVNPPAPIRRDLLRSIAAATLDLLQIRKPGESAMAWVKDKILRTRLKRALMGELSDVSADDCRALLADISKFHIPALDNAPHVIVHGDLQASNIIVREQRLECIIDFGHAAMVPLQFSAVFPRFLTNEPQLNGIEYDWSRCVYSEVQRNDRSYYQQCIEELASRKGDEARSYASVLLSAEQEERYWWFSAVSRLDIMRALKTKPK